MGLSADLRLVLGEDCLLRLALEAAQGVAICNREVAAASGSVSPRMLFTLLCYCYAAGIYASKDVERAMRTDPMVAYICAGADPGWETMCRFRRSHLGALRDALTHLFTEARRLGRTGLDAHEQANPAAPFGAAVALEVKRRLEAAMLMDAAESDF
jgi:hypothetical protein